MRLRTTVARVAALLLILGSSGPAAAQVSSVDLVLQAGPEFKVLGKNAVGEMCWSSPAAAGGALFLRTVDHLFCFRNSGGGK